jgi:hypothetical protein
MKCELCQKDTKTLVEGPNGVGLCVECNEEYQKQQEEKAMEEMKVNAVEENVEGEAPAQKAVKCEVVIGVFEDGNLYFNAGGEAPDLLTIDGLLKYAERRVKQIWDARDIELARAAQAAAEEGKTE